METPQLWHCNFCLSTVLNSVYSPKTLITALCSLSSQGEVPFLQLDVPPKSSFSKQPVSLPWAHSDVHTDLLNFHLFWNLCAWNGDFLLVKAFSICRTKHRLPWILETFEVREELEFWYEDCNNQLAIIRASSHSIISRLQEQFHQLNLLLCLFDVRVSDGLCYWCGFAQDGTLP